MIEVRNVYKRFGSQVVLNGVNLTVEEGETLALLGPSGTGKSVLLKSIIGLIHPERGEIIADHRHHRGDGKFADRPQPLHLRLAEPF